MTTAAAIDRLVHHSMILELDVPSFRLEHASKNQALYPSMHHPKSRDFPLGKSNCR